MSLNLPAPGFMYDLHNEAQARAILEREDLLNLKSNLFPRANRLWTPTIGGTATYNSQIGTVARAGRLVVFSCFLDILLRGTGSQTTIGTLPYLPSANGGTRSFKCSFFNNIATAVTSLGAYAAAASGSIVFTCLTAAAVSVTNAPNVFQNGAQVNVSGSYETDDA